MTELGREASYFDIGLFAIQGNSEQNRHVLPNKFFEYCMAGLALCVSDLPEMRNLVEQKSLGLMISEPSPEAIAIAINSLDKSSIEIFKKNALVAAQELCWDSEGQKLLRLVSNEFYMHR